MTNEERDIIAKFVARVAGAAPQQGAWGGGASVPATQPQLPPVDSEADRFIAEQFQAYPAARYRITQLAFVQEHALIEAQNRLRRMEWELQQAQQAAQQSGGQQRPGGGFFSNLFGGNRSSAPPPRGGPWGQAPGQGYAYGAPPPPQYPPGYQPNVFQRAGGSGFLGSALTTAAGVAGGMLAADAIRDMFSPHHGIGGAMGEGGLLGAAAPDPGYVDQGTWTDPNAGVAPDPGYVDQGTWDQGGQSGWPDSGSVPDDTSGGGWDQGGGGWDQGSGGGSDDSLI